MVTVYHDGDARVGDLAAETVAVIGHGIHGRAHDLGNMEAEAQVRQRIRLAR